MGEEGEKEKEREDHRERTNSIPASSLDAGIGFSDTLRYNAHRAEKGTFFFC